MAPKAMTIPLTGDNTLPAYDDVLTGAVTNLKLNDLNSTENDCFPTPGQAIAHLELLTAFSNLRKDVRGRDGLFDLWDNDANSSVTIEEIQEKRWAVFVTAAVERFTIWWKALTKIADGPKLTVQDTWTHYRPAYLARYQEKSRYSMVQQRQELPPLGMLLVRNNMSL